MTHYYELRKCENDGTINTVKKFSAEPKKAKLEAEIYAKKNPGIYTLWKIEVVKHYITTD